MRDKEFFEEINARIKEGANLSSSVYAAWYDYRRLSTRSEALYKLWCAMFPADRNLSSKVHTINFLELSDKLSASGYSYHKLSNAKLVIGRSIGVRQDTQTNARYLDNYNDIFELFRILYAHGDTIVNYVSPSHQAPLKDLITAIRESPDFDKYIYPDNLKFTTTGSYKFYTTETYSSYYSKHSSTHDGVEFEGTKDSHTCKCKVCGQVIISERSKDDDNLVICSASQGLISVIDHLNKLSKEVHSGNNIKEIRDKLSHHILLNII